MKKTGIVAVLFTSALINMITPCASQVVCAREYQSGTTLELGPLIKPPPGGDVLKRVRAFLWCHWKSHLPGEITLIQHGIEGQRVESRYSIEKDAFNRCFLIRTDRQKVMRNGKVGMDERV